MVHDVHIKVQLQDLFLNVILRAALALTIRAAAAFFFLATALFLATLAFLTATTLLATAPLLLLAATTFLLAATTLLATTLTILLTTHTLAVTAAITGTRRIRACASELELHDILYASRSSRRTTKSLSRLASLQHIVNVSAHALIVVFLFLTMGHDAPIHPLALEETLVHRQHLIVLEITNQRENAPSPC